MFEHGLRLLLLLAVWCAPLPFCTWLAGRDRQAGSFGHDLLAVLTTWLACQMTIPLLLGAAGLLGAWSVYAFQAILLCAGIALRRLRPGRTILLWPSRTATAWEAGFVFVGVVVAGLGFWSLLRTPTSNYDSFAYHLPAMIWWAQHGSFEFLPDLQHAAYYAFDWEIASLLSVYPLHDDLFIAVPNLLAWAMWGLAIHLLARRLGASAGASASVSLLTLTMFTVVARLDAAQPDLVLAAYFIAAIYFGLVAHGDDARVSRALTGFALLILPGLKMSGLVYAPLALAAIFALGWATTGRRPRVRAWSRGQLAIWAWGLLLGSFWYLRNVALNGNPFGFLTVDLFGHALFQGDQTRAELARTALLAVFDPGDAGDWKTLARTGWQNLGPGLVALVAAALVSWTHPSRRVVVALFGVGAWTLFAYWSAPYSGDNGSRNYEFTSWFSVGLRYAYPFFSLLAVGAAIGLTRVRIGERIGLLIVVGCLLYTLIFKLSSPGLAMRWSVGVAFVGAACLLLRERWGRRWMPPALGVVAFALLVWQSHELDAQRDAQRLNRYGYLHAYMEENVPADAVVGYARTHRRYQLFGKHLRREVLCVDARQETPEAWLKRLRRLEIDFVAVGMADNAEIARAGLPDVRAWIDAMQEHFELLFPAQSEAKDLELYRLR